MSNVSSKSIIVSDLNTIVSHSTGFDIHWIILCCFPNYIYIYIYILICQKYIFFFDHMKQLYIYIYICLAYFCYIPRTELLAPTVYLSSDRIVEVGVGAGGSPGPCPGSKKEASTESATFRGIQIKKNTSVETNSIETIKCCHKTKLFWGNKHNK